MAWKHPRIFTQANIVVRLHEVTLSELSESGAEPLSEHPANADAGLSVRFTGYERDVVHDWEPDDV